MTPATLRSLIVPNAWLDAAIARVGADPTAIAALFPAAGRHCGRTPIDEAEGWRADDVARCLLLLALPLTAAALADEVTALYRFGDADEKRAVLRGLAFLDLGDAGLELTRDALRSNDTRLVAAALGPHARRLDDEAWRHGVLKCVFMGIPLSVVDSLDDRADVRLAAMLDALARERTAAGRTMPADAVALLDRLSRGEPSRAHL
jgi:hypothetical protein